MVEIVVGNVRSKILGFLSPEAHNELSKTLSYKLAGARHMPLVKAGKWDGVIRLYSRQNGFYTGLMSFVREVLKKHNIDYRLVNRRPCPEPNMPDLKYTAPPNYEERPYQDLTVDRAINQFTRGILKVSTGGGKTSIVTRIIGEIKTSPFIFYVLTTDLMEQAHEELSRCLNTKIGRIGDGHADIQPISVCTIQTAIRSLHSDDKDFKISDYQFDEEDKWDEKSVENLGKAEAVKKYIQSAKGVYLDESHHAAGSTIKETLESSPMAYWRFGGTATPYREDGADIMIQAMFGAKIVDINASYLIQNDYLVKPYIFFEPIDHECDFHSYSKIYSHCIAQNDRFNSHVADTANHLVSRGLSTLVLVKQYNQGDYLKPLIPNSEFVTGRMTTKKRSQALNDLRSRNMMCMIATSLADEGLDVPSLDAVLLAGGGASATRVNQRIGRALRIDKEGNKNKSIIVAYEHQNVRHLDKHSKKVRRILKEEPEFELISSKGQMFIKEEIDDLLGIQEQTRLF